jgi:hypothetical protein
MVVERGIGASTFEINFHGRPCGFMQRNKPAFAELGTSNHQTICGDVVEAESDRFRYAEACT